MLKHWSNLLVNTIGRTLLCLPLKRGGMSVLTPFLEKVGFLSEFVYGKYSEVGGGNLKNRTKLRKTLLCACV